MIKNKKRIVILGGGFAGLKYLQSKKIKEYKELDEVDDVW